MVMRRERSKGVSLLLELLLGFSLLAIALLTLFRLFPAAERATVLADKSLHAHHLASEILDTQLARPYSAFNVGVFEDVEPFQHTQRRGVEMTTVYHYRLEITRPYPGQDIYHVAVTVTWEEGSAGTLRPSAIRLEGEKGRLW